MAKDTQSLDELDALAFEIFKQHSGSATIASEQLAHSAYAKAAAFLDMKAKVRSGFLAGEKQAERAGCDCRAPNLPDDHPHNLVSREVGSLDLVVKIAAWLAAHPQPAEEIRQTINRQFKLNWDVPEINVARVIFPAYVNN